MWGCIVDHVHLLLPDGVENTVVGEAQRSVGMSSNFALDDRRLEGQPGRQPGGLISCPNGRVKTQVDDRMRRRSKQIRAPRFTPM